MTSLRPDLLALGDDSLTVLANRGIVKRAAREVAEGRGPTLDVADDGTVTGEFADGSRVALAPGTTVDNATACSCPASGLCRHVVMVVVAYREQVRLPGQAAWSPGEFSDDDLEALVGSRVLKLARKALRAGYRAQIRRPTSADPVPTVELPSCTVRFLVPHELGYAHVDAARGTREDAVVLAVWAFRAADTTDRKSLAVEVGVGGSDGDELISSRGSGIEPALDLVADLLADGVVHTGQAATTTIAQVRRMLERRNLRWPIDVLDEVAGQLDAYRRRRASYGSDTVARLLAELVARHRCVVGGGAALRSGVLGTEEAAETPLRLLRLTGLGASVTGGGSSRSVEVYLAHVDAGVVLTVRRRVDVDDDDPPGGEILGRRKVGGARLSALAAGNVVTESAVRSANRVVRFAENRVARTTVTASTGRWDELPPSILVDDLDAGAARLAGLPPAVVRPRVTADAIRAVVVDDVDDVVYHAGAQRLDVSIRAPTGRGTVSLTHTSATAGAIGTLADTLDGTSGPIRFVAGHLRLHGGEVVIEPSAVVAGTSVIVPAFAPPTAVTITARGHAVKDPLVGAVDDALAVSSEVPHRGWRHLPPEWRARAERCADQLRRVGLHRAGTALTDLATVTRAAPDHGALPRWADTHIRLLVTAEQH
jgi:SWIM zinc finger